MTLLFLVRHARSTWNTEGRWQGQADPPLDELGLKQAHAVAARLQDEALAAIYTSPLQRAKQTAEIIAATCHAPLIADNRLMERNVGEWAGLTSEEVKARYPDSFKPGWWVKGAPGGETQAELVARVEVVFNEILVAHPDTNVAVISHGGTLNSFLSNLFASQHGVFAFENASLAQVQVRGESVRLLRLGETAHLDGLE